MGAGTVSAVLGVRLQDHAMPMALLPEVENGLTLTALGSWHDESGSKSDHADERMSVMTGTDDVVAR